MTYSEFKNKWLGRRVDIELFGWMNSGVFSPSNQHKVLNPIICLVVVNVVDNLVRLQKTAKMFLHDKPMFSNRFMVSIRMFGRIYGVVTARSSFATPPPWVVGHIFSNIRLVALVTAKYVFPFLATPILVKLLETVVAPKQALSRLIVTVSRTSPLLSTRPSVLAGRGLVFNRTNITNVFHKFNYTHNNVWSQ